MTRRKKIKIPQSVKELRLSSKAYAKKHHIRLSGKGMSKGQKKRNRRRLKLAYSEAAIVGLNKAVKILSENTPDNKKILKIKDGVDNIILNVDVMKRISKLYLKNPDRYQNLIFLPKMIIQTLSWYSSEDIDDKEKKIGEALDPEALTEFCEKILKKIIKRYRKMGLSDDIAFQLASVVPTTKILHVNRQNYKQLIASLYMIAEKEDVDVKTILSAVQKIDKSKSINKKEFYEGFYSNFIFSRSSNRNHSFTDSQKELHETLIEKSLEYLDAIRKRDCREILKNYIKRRKTAESKKNDCKRVIKFIDHANSNSSYTNLKTVIQELISDNSSNELYLS